MDETSLKTRSGLELLNVHCSTCGAPAAYDIVKHTYACAYCGSATGIDEALAQKKGFRALRQAQLQSRKEDFSAVSCTCSGLRLWTAVTRSRAVGAWWRMSSSVMASV